MLSLGNSFAVELLESIETFEKSRLAFVLAFTAKTSNHPKHNANLKP